jgi:hypothetical protein
METPEERYLEAILQNWAAQRQALPQVRARLLWLAGHTSPAGEPPYVCDQTLKRAAQSFNWCSYFLTWNIDQPIRTSLSALYGLA